MHHAGKWSRIVGRGSQADPREPQLRPEEIDAWLAKHARRS